MLSKIQFSLRTQLGFWMLLVAFGPLLLAGVVTVGILWGRVYLLSSELDQAEDYLRGDIVGRNLTGAAADTVVAIDSYLLERINDVRFWTEDPSIVAAARQGGLAAQKMSLGLVASNPDAVDLLLEGENFVPITYTVFSPAHSFAIRQIQRQPVFLEILLLEGHGLSVMATRPVGQVTFANEDWWQAANRLDGAGIGIREPLIDPGSGQPALAITLPVIDPDTRQLLGSLRAVLSLKELQTRLSQKAVSTTANIQLVTRSGQLLADTASDHAPRLLLAARPLDNDPAIRKALTALPGPGGAGFTVVSEGEVSMLSGFGRTSGAEFYDGRAGLTRFPGLGWGVVVSQPEALAMQPLSQLRRTEQSLSQMLPQLLALFALMGILALALGVLGTIFISGQIDKQLAARARPQPLAQDEPLVK